jgi:hypothetical protein
MTVAPEVPVATTASTSLSRDHRGSWVPTPAMIATRFMELRKRRGVMAALIGVTIGIPTLFLLIRLLLHAVAPHTYGPAGGYNVFSHLVAGVLYLFGFIVAATLGCTAGAVDLTEGMFRHLVITGRSRLSLYLARIPAGLAIVLPIVAIGYAIVCVVCVFAAPANINYQGVSVPAGMSRAGFVAWASDHAEAVVCNFPVDQPVAALPATCPNSGPPPGVILKGSNGPQIHSAPVPTPATAAPLTPAQTRALAVHIANNVYSDYSQFFGTLSTSLMIKAGLWIELEAIIGFMVGLGLASLLGQRTIAVVMMIVLEIIITPIAARARIPHFANVQRAVVGLAMAHLEPGSLPLALGGARGVDLLSESTAVAVCVIVAWLVGWTVLGAWRMVTRDA